MSDGTLNLPKRSSIPDSPTPNRYKIYVDSSDDEVKYIDELGVVRTFKGDKGDQGDQGPVGPQGPQGIQGPTGPMNVEALVSEKSTVTLPNSTSFNLVYSDTVTVSAAGNLFLDVSLAIKPHSTGNDMIFEIDFDGVTQTPDYTEEHKDTNSAQSMWRSQCIPLGFFSAGTYDLELYFRKEATGGTAQLKNYTAKVVRY